MAAMAAALRQVPPFTPLKRETTPEDAPTQLKTIDALLEARGFGETDAGVLSRVEDLLERYQARGESVQRLAGKMSALDAHRRGSEDELGAIPLLRKELDKTKAALKQSEAARRRAESEKFAETARVHEALSLIHI